jgi:hypothetical protein
MLLPLVAMPIEDTEQEQKQGQEHEIIGELKRAGG